MALKERRLAEPAPDALAEHRNDDLPLQQLDHAAKLVQAHAARGKVDLLKVAGHQLVRHPEPAGDDVQLNRIPLVDPGRGDRLVKFDILCPIGVGEHPRLELLDGAARAVLQAGRSDRRILVLGTDHDADQTRLGFLAGQLGQLPVVKVAQSAQRRGAPGHTPVLRPLPLEQVGDVLRLHPARVQTAPCGAGGVARMVGEQVIGDAPADGVIFDALRRATARIVGEAVGVQVVGFHQLDLQGQGQAVRLAPPAPDREHVATLEHFPNRQPQNAVPIGVAVRVALLRPFGPERVDLLVQRLVLGARPRADPVADRRTDQNLNRLRGHRVVPDQIAHAVAQHHPGTGHLGIGRRRGRAPVARQATL